MSDISPIGPPGAVATTPAGRANQPGAPAAETPRGSDQAVISQTAQLLSKLSELPAVRQNLIDRVKGQIAQGTYETPEKVDAAIDSLAQDIKN